jgi:hypothetical protein
MVLKPCCRLFFNQGFKVAMIILIYLCSFMSVAAADHDVPLCACPLAYSQNVRGRLC